MWWRVYWPATDSGLMSRLPVQDSCPGPSNSRGMAHPHPNRPAVLVAVRCPACGLDVVSPSLTPSEILDRHLRYCTWEPEGDLTA